jgi:enamidase
VTNALITNIGAAATGVFDAPDGVFDEILIRDGKIAALGSGFDAEDGAVIDAAGLMAIPGLIDSHVHPVVGDVSVVPRGAGWLDEYLNAGMTSCISAGELTIPGFGASSLEPAFCVSVATAAAQLYAALGDAPRVYAGTVLAVPGMTRDDLATVVAAGGLCLKYIYYPFDRADPGEVANYRDWSRELGLVTRLHSGGTSFRGGSVAAGRGAVELLQPDIVCHLNGGPIPMSDEDVRFVVETSGAWFEVIMGGNLRLVRAIAGWAAEAGTVGRLLCGTDTPGGSGITPRAMLQLLALLAGSCGLEPSIAVAAATGSVAEAHRLNTGRLEVGRRADIVLVGAVRGSRHHSAQKALRSGEIPGVGVVLCGGRVVALPGRLTPPPASLPRVIKSEADAG